MALYFVWIAFMAKMMLLPAALSLVWYFFRYGNIDIVKDPFMPIFAALMALWSILYLVVSAGKMISWISSPCPLLSCGVVIVRNLPSGGTRTTIDESKNRIRISKAS